MTTRRLTTISMLIAVYVVLSCTQPIRLINFHLTFEAFPILIAGLLFGPVDGLLVGGLGSTVYQLFFSGYGITVTTPLWILPHAISGLLVGLLAKKLNKEIDFKASLLIAITSAFTVTLLNSIAIYADSKIFHYYFKGIVTGNLAIKLVTGVLLSIVYSLALPSLVGQLKKIIKLH